MSSQHATRTVVDGEPAPPAQILRSGRDGRWTFAVVVATGFGVLLAVGLAYHALWRDELQGWAIARHSETPWELLHNLRYEGHPPLWYLVLWLPARITSSTVALQGLQWATATSTVFLFARFAPFSRWLRVVFALGYFPLFEYGVLTRSYSLGLLIVVAILAVADRRPRSWTTLGVLLGLLALTSVFGIILALSLALGLVCQRDPAGAWHLRDRDSRVGAAFLALGALLSACLVRPPADGLYTAWRTAYEPDALTRVLSTPWRALVPAPHLQTAWWNTNALDRSPDVAMLLGVAVVVLVALVLRRHTEAVVVWVTTTLLTIGLTYARDLPLWLRQEGTLYVAFVAATWIACAHRGVRPSRAIRDLVAVVFVVQAAIGIASFAAAGTTQFTGADAAARWIADHERNDVVLVGDNAAVLSSVAYRLDRSIVFPEKPSGEPFVLWKRALQPSAPSDLSEARGAHDLAMRIARRDAHPVLLVLREPLPDDTGARLLAQFPGGIVGDERYWIYAP